MKIITTILTALMLTAVSAMAQLNWDGPRHLNVFFKSVSGAPALRMDIYLPKDAVRATPVVVYTHGGGWSTGAKESIEIGSQSQVALGLLESGVAVVSVNYRLTNNSDITMRDCIIDTKDACRFLVREQRTYNINTRLMACFGDSAGAHIAMMTALISPYMAAFRGASALDSFQGYKVRGCAAFYGPSSFRSADARFWAHRSLGGFNSRVFGTETDSAAQEFERELVSPINYLTSSSPPLFVVHGLLDTTIPINHTYGFRTLSNSDSRIPFEFVVVRNATHNFRLSADAPATGTAISPSRAEIEDMTVEKILSFF